MSILNFCKAIALTAVTSIALMHAPARADMVDFNSHPSPVYPVPGGVINSGGFTFSAPWVGVVNGSESGWQFGVGNNSPMLVFFGDGTDFLTVSRTNGGLFSLSSVDVGRWLGLDQATPETLSPNASLSITGYTGSGFTGAHQILAPFTLPGFTNNFSTLSIPQQFASLSFQSLTFHLSAYTPGGYVAVDNLVLTPVPEPETYALLLAGLGLLAVIGRRRKTLG
jgi:hypothetical protein